MKYNELVIEVVKLDSEDVITTSPITNGGEGGDVGEVEWPETNPEKTYKFR